MRSPVLVSSLVLLAAVGGGCMPGRASQQSNFVRFAPAATPRAATADAHRGSRGSPAVGNFVRSRIPQLQFCYDEARLTNATLAGSATVAVTLHQDGGVLRAQVTERSWNGDGKAVEDCMLTTVRRWRFPESDPLDETIHSFRVLFNK